jgi:PilZ domain
MVERRAPPPRKRTFKAGILEFNRGGGISGIVKNLSESGAMIEVESVIGIPDEFTLFIEADHFRRSCKVVWRQPSKIGVRFR